MPHDDETTVEGRAAYTASARYERLAQKRQPFLDRAREVAEVTIPTLIRKDEGKPTGSEEYPSPFQSVGARGTTNLGAKLLLALFPPGSSFFRKKLDPGIEDELRETGQLTQVEEDLVLFENVVMDFFESTNSRPILAQVFRHLIVAGNKLLEVTPKGRFKAHPLTDYVVARDGEGKCYEIIYREAFVRDTLDEEVQELIAASPSNEPEEDDDDTIWLYTVAELRDGKWWVYEEIDDVLIPGSVYTEPEDSPSLIPLRWNVADREDYGRGLGEEYLGDLQTLESLTQSIVEFSAAAAKILYFVDETGQTRKSDIEYKRSGAVVDGRASDVSTLQLEKFHDFQVADKTAKETKERLEAAFLLNSSIQRNAERVTAEEIRFMAGELESALGGVYSTLSQELQLPLVKLLERHLRRKDRLPDLEGVKSVIVTGLEGLGRQGDLIKLDLLIQGIGSAFGAEAVPQTINLEAYVRRRAAALGIDVGDLVFSQEEQARRANAQAQREQAVKAAPQGVDAIKEMALRTAEAEQTGGQ